MVGEQLSLEPLLEAAREPEPAAPPPPLRLTSRHAGGRRYEVFDGTGAQVGAIWDGGEAFVRWYSRGKVGSGSAANRDLALDHIRRDLEERDDDD